jgi:threonine dehydrogenase-like Zn-dependent dehydrogenase
VSKPRAARIFQIAYPKDGHKPRPKKGAVSVSNLLTWKSFPSQSLGEGVNIMENQMMQALVWLGPRNMVQREEPMPQLEPGEVLISIGAAGICGSELSGFLGHNSLRVPPLIMGHECAGHVVRVTEGTFATGEAATIGARVTFNPLVVCGTCDRCLAGRSNLCRRRQLVGAHRPGGFAQYVTVPARQCYPLPERPSASLSLVAGSLAEPLACSIRAVAHSGIKPQERLLILGAGPIGLFAVAAALRVVVRGYI